MVTKHVFVKGDYGRKEGASLFSLYPAASLTQKDRFRALKDIPVGTQGLSGPTMPGNLRVWSPVAYMCAHLLRNRKTTVM